MYKEFDEASKYPNEIDPLIFYQDITIDKKEYMDEYYRLISEKKYTEASQYIADKEVDGMFAGLINLLVNRVKATQEHIATRTKQEKVFLDKEPTNTEHGTICIGLLEDSGVDVDGDTWFLNGNRERVYYLIINEDGTIGTTANKGESLLSTDIRYGELSFDFKCLYAYKHSKDSFYWLLDSGDRIFVPYSLPAGQDEDGDYYYLSEDQEKIYYLDYTLNGFDGKLHSGFASDGAYIYDLNTTYCYKETNNEETGLTYRYYWLLEDGTKVYVPEELYS